MNRKLKTKVLGLVMLGLTLTPVAAKAASITSYGHKIYPYVNSMDTFAWTGVSGGNAVAQVQRANMFTQVWSTVLNSGPVFSYAQTSQGNFATGGDLIYRSYHTETSTNTSISSLY